MSTYIAVKEVGQIGCEIRNQKDCDGTLSLFTHLSTPNQFPKVTTLTGTTAGVRSAGAAVSPSLASHGPLVNILARLTGRAPMAIVGPSDYKNPLGSQGSSNYRGPSDSQSPSNHQTSSTTTPLTVRVPLTVMSHQRLTWL